DGTFTYSPNGRFEHLAAGQTATDSFTYTVTDNHGGSSTQTATVTITGQNDAPVAVAIAAGANEDGPTVTLSANYSDVDTSDIHSFSVNTSGTLGSVVNNGDGTFAYSPNGQFEHLAAGETASDTFSYTVTDNHGASSTQTATVTITGQNDAPVAVAISGSASEDGPTATLSANYSDVDTSDTHSFSVNTSGTLGSVVNNGDGNFTYSPNGQFEHLAAGETATDTFSYAVTDNHGASSTQTATVTITGQNDAPIAVADSNAATEDTTISGSVASNDSDVDDGTVLSYSLNTPVAGLTLNADGSYSFDASNAAYQHLAQGQTADVVANYTVTDEHGATSTTSLTITLTGTNDAAVISGTTSGTVT